MNPEKLKILTNIGLCVLSNILFLLFLFFLLAREHGWRLGGRKIWEYTLVIALYFALIIVGTALLFPSLSKWLHVHTHFSGQQIDAERIRVERIVAKKTVVFSNGEERAISGWHTLLMIALIIGWWILGLLITRRVARRFAPMAWAEITADRGRPTTDRIVNTKRDAAEVGDLNTRS